MRSRFKSPFLSFEPISPSTITFLKIWSFKISFFYKKKTLNINIQQILEFNMFLKLI